MVWQLRLFLVPLADKSGAGNSGPGKSKGGSQICKPPFCVKIR
jgi:hypothetical protein